MIYFCTDTESFRKTSRAAEYAWQSFSFLLEFFVAFQCEKKNVETAGQDCKCLQENDRV